MCVRARARGTKIGVLGRRLHITGRLRFVAFSARILALLSIPCLQGGCTLAFCSLYGDCNSCWSGHFLFYPRILSRFPPHLLVGSALASAVRSIYIRAGCACMCVPACKPMCTHTRHWGAARFSRLFLDASDTFRRRMVWRSEAVHRAVALVGGPPLGWQSGALQQYPRSVSDAYPTYALHNSWTHIQYELYVNQALPWL